MKITWYIEPADIEKVKRFYDLHKDNPFLQKRIERNIEATRYDVSKSHFFKTMVACLLTSQQRSGPDSPVTKFIRTEPFPLDYNLCASQSDPQYFIHEILSNFGGLRFSTKIANEVASNLARLENGLWDDVFIALHGLQTQPTAQKERETAEFIDHNFKGFGPKQSRNLLQALGLTKYEIPIDSRISKKLSEFGFPIKLSAQSLSDRYYYNFVSDGIQALCKECGIYPCALDAAIFSSFDKGNWTEGNIIW